MKAGCHVLTVDCACSGKVNQHVPWTGSCTGEENNRAKQVVLWDKPFSENSKVLELLDVRCRDVYKIGYADLCLIQLWVLRHRLLAWSDFWPDINVLSLTQVLRPFWGAVLKIIKAYRKPRPPMIIFHNVRILVESCKNQLPSGFHCKNFPEG